LQGAVVRSGHRTSRRYSVPLRPPRRREASPSPLVEDFFMHDQPLGLSPVLRRLTAAAATLCVVGTGLSSLGAAPASADPADERPQLSVDPSLGAAADIGFHDDTRDGSERPLRDDLAGEL